MKICKLWYQLLKSEFEKDYYLSLQKFLIQEYKHYTIYPAVDNVFNALNMVPYHKVRVVIIGQDPYHQPNQAHGLCFSVQDGVPLPPSLLNIYKELQNDLGIPISKSGNLTNWARQGVLLLNSVLTVRANCPNSHKGQGWEQFSNAIIEILNQKSSPIIFVLWGNNAKTFATKIDTTKHFILTAPHPSPLSAYSGFFGCKHFSKINEFLKSIGQPPIDWSVEPKL